MIRLKGCIFPSSLAAPIGLSRIAKTAWGEARFGAVSALESEFAWEFRIVFRIISFFGDVTCLFSNTSSCLFFSGSVWQGKSAGLAPATKRCRKSCIPEAGQAKASLTAKGSGHVAARGIRVSEIVLAWIILEIERL